MLKSILISLDKISPAPKAHAHCSGPCGVYDPSTARIAAEAVKSMMDKIDTLRLSVPDPTDKDDYTDWHLSMARYTMIKEEQAEIVKRELLIMWSDAFDKTETFWTTKDGDFYDYMQLINKCKEGRKAADAVALIDAVEVVFDKYFYDKKGRTNPPVSWFLAKV